MVVEYLIRPSWVVKKPIYALLLGVCLSFIGTSIGLFIFPDEAAIAGILFTTIAATPFLGKILDTVDADEFWERNGKIASIYGLFFFGIALAYGIWYFILPAQASAFFFDKQISVLVQPLTSIGFFSQTQSSLIAIISNNLKLVIFALVLSFIYGAGATILITWNASVLGIFMASLGKFTTMLAFVPHASLEFIAFFFAAIAGGLLSIAVDEEKTQFKSDKFYQAINDSAMLFMLAIGIIVLAGFIEVYAFMV
jgi:uncharacterized membrane protein SpoIIM required for sporulation